MLTTRDEDLKARWVSGSYFLYFYLSTLYTSYMILTCGNVFCCISKDS